MLDHEIFLNFKYFFRRIFLKKLLPQTTAGKTPAVQQQLYGALTNLTGL
jgi:hypothetical protein